MAAIPHVPAIPPVDALALPPRNNDIAPIGHAAAAAVVPPVNPLYEKKRKWPFVGRKKREIPINYVPMRNTQTINRPADSSRGGGMLGRMKPLMPNILDMQEENAEAARKSVRDSSGRKWVKVIESTI